MDEVSATAQRFLEDRPTATLGTLFEDGSPQASVVWYLWEDGEFIISTVHTTAKWHNLKRDPRSSVVVEDPETGEMVVAYGPARLEDRDVRSRTRDLVDKYYDDPAKTDAHMDRIFATPDRVLIHVRPEKLITRRLD
jgi:PPOX class probable F420-dependent enzyme